MSNQWGQCVASSVLEGFANYRSTFTYITLGAKRRFESACWLDVQQASMDRINLYDDAVAAVTDCLTQEVAQGYTQLSVWKDAKRYYTELVRSRTDGELAETFFNSIFCRIFRHHEIKPENLFVFSTQPKVKAADEASIIISYRPAFGLVKMVDRILMDFSFAIPYADRRQDVVNIIRTAQHQLGFVFADSKDMEIDIIRSVFYRNKAAYLVGRVRIREDVKPFIIALMNNERGGIYVDALITDPDEVSIIFSFTRSYFMVDAPVPAAFIAFLQDLLPWKQRYELYNSIGFYKHGKTEFYRDFVQHLDKTDDQFIIAPGVRGMVMIAFTLPSSQTVFKVIKDNIAPQKEVNKETVKKKYYLVKMHDRVGRMADTQEFSHFAFPKDRFHPELLAELLTEAHSVVRVVDDLVIIDHLYTERRMIPLNLYIKDASEQQLESVLDDFGNAIKQLAAANIFPGDMLLKNFGVTRHGRIVFYDYDEICYLTECNFRRIPPPRFPEDEMAAEPWYSVGVNDVFPEEFAIFIFADTRIRKCFTELHGELFDAGYWQRIQQVIREKEVVDVFPYRRKRRLARRMDEPKVQAREK
ncbi:bifunctional isocitrate dehydrogenase kinase/phosphatase [Zooshikella sp. RANM57]|uniref:bifunctional isocitrate dehydrogenase kinase/phosphatase n=1 Tax=Zooshikella sp. RANM57 TaxID=3425863 RepID=UPI003D6F8FAA